MSTVWPTGNYLKSLYAQYRFELAPSQKINYVRDLDMQPALISIHDVMPETLLEVQYCLDQCRQHNNHTVYLLVVPGRFWDEQQIEQLKQWVSEGCVLVGHGWKHHTACIEGVRHRLHSMLISRNVAEHLALDENGILALMQRCYSWFETHQLPEPQLYVPPAWALGQVRLNCLQSVGFKYVETLRGIVDVAEQRWISRPLLGYEADTQFRAGTLSIWNRANKLLPGGVGLPRLAIHPHDFNLKLSKALHNDLAQYNAITLSDAFSLTKTLITAGR